MSELIAGASATVAGRARNPSGSDELIQGVREWGEVAQLSRGRKLVLLGVAVDPDGAKPERMRRDNVVEVALRHMDVSVSRGAGFLEEAQPVRMTRLVRTDLRGHDHQLERHADLLQRGVDEVPVRVREDCKLPASRPYLLQCRAHFREGLPGGQRGGQACFLTGG